MKGLILKDLLLHRKNLLLLCAALTALPLLLHVARPQLPWRDLGSLQRYMSLILVFSLIAIVEWLIGTEVSQRTMTWLRTTPLSDWTIIGSKYIVFAVFLWAAIVIPMLILFPIWLTKYPMVIITYGFWMEVCGGMALGSRMLFKQKIGFMAPLIVILVFVLLGATGHLGPLLIRILNRQSFSIGVSMILYVVLFITTTLIMSTRETRRWGA